MAVFVLTNARVEVNSVDLSTYVRQVTLNTEVDAQETTAMGATYRARLGGLKDWSADVEFNQDFALAAVDATLWPLIGVATTVKIRPTASTIGPTNPEYSGSGILESYPPLDGSVGDAAMTSVTFTGAGTLSRATA